jgi:hypothetical protein
MSTKQNLSNNKNNKNSLNNIYSSYQINSHIMNKINNIKNKFNNREDIFRNGSSSKRKKIYVNALNNKTFALKYISVNKSLFSPKNKNNQKIGFNINNDDKKTLQINRIKKNKFTLNNDFIKREYSTITIVPQIKRDSKVKKIFSNRKMIINHKKSNSIQWPNYSIKKFLRTDKSLSIDNSNNSQINSAVREFNKIKTLTMKNNNKSPILNIDNLSDRFIKRKHVNKCLHNFLLPYGDKRTDNRGRNENSIKMGNSHIKENSISFINKNYMNSCDNFSKNNKCFNIIYNNTQDLSRDFTNNNKK